MLSGNGCNEKDTLHGRVGESQQEPLFGEKERKEHKSNHDDGPEGDRNSPILELFGH